MNWGEPATRRVAFRVEDRALAEDRPGGNLHAVHSLDGLQVLVGEGRNRSVLLLDLGFAGDRDVDAFVRLGEDVVEGTVGGVGQHVGAGDQSDAENHREGGHQGAPLARPEVLEGEAKQGS
ncbi:MAG: hypothetical protein IPK93_12930 [Solirubrobacterales bacterium]|nr:hypothetical protein [Solirubrobacterales bacterium]